MTDAIHESATLDPEASDELSLSAAVIDNDDMTIPPIEGDIIQNLPAATAARVMEYVPAIKARQFLPVPVETIKEMAEFLACMPGLAGDLRGNVPAVAAVILQAIDWKISPAFAVRYAYQAKNGGPIGYEAKVLNAVIISNAPLRQRPRYRFGYGGDGKATVLNRFVVAEYDIIGSDRIQTLRSPCVSQIKTKNSPEWYSHTDKQLIYYIGRAAANALFPDVLGGAFSREEVAFLAAQEKLEGLRERSLFEEDDEGADFGDGIPVGGEAPVPASTGNRHPNAPDDDGKPQAPQKPQNAPKPPPAGNVQPDDLPALRDWLGGEQRRILALTGGPDVSAAWTALLRDDRIGRIKAYDQAVFNAVKASVTAHIASLRG